MDVVGFSNQYVVMEYSEKTDFIPAEGLYLALDFASSLHLLPRMEMEWYAG